MLEILTGAGLAGAAGLNAWIPLLMVGLLARFTGLLTLPPAWEWLTNGWVLTALAVLLVIEIVADKVPVLDHVNDVVHTFIRPASGGLVFGAGSSADTASTIDVASASVGGAGELLEGGRWLPVVAGILIALVVHLLKATTRTVLNAMSFGLAAPVISTAEDLLSVTTALVAIIVPVLVLPVLAGFVLLGVWTVRRRRQRRAGVGPPAVG
jgi:hypothetical protein